MEVKLQLLGIYPPLSSTQSANDQMILLILNDNGGKVYLINDLFNKQEGLVFTSTDKLVKCALYKNHSFLGYGEITVNTEAKWINFSNTIASTKSEPQEITQLRLKCFVLSPNHKRKSKPLMTSHYNSSKTTHAKQGTHDLNQTMTQDKAKLLSIKEALLSPVPLTAKKKNSLITMQKVDVPKLYHKGNLIVLKPLQRKNKEKYRNSNKTYNESSYEANTIVTCEGNASYLNATSKTSNKKKQQSTDIKKGSEASGQRAHNKRNNTDTSFGYSTNKKIPFFSLSQDKLNVSSNKLEDRFESIEERIIDKKFENNIGKDEMIIYQEKSMNNCSLCSSGDESESFEALYEDNTNEEGEFENLKADFDIFYTEEYLKQIRSEVLSLELQLFIDKMCQLQETYHAALGDKLQAYAKNLEVFDYFRERYVLLKKSANKLNDMNDMNITRKNMNNSILNSKNSVNKDTLALNEKEVQIWKMLDLLVKSPVVKVKINRKKQLMNIFSTVTRKNKGKNGFDYEGLCDGLIKRTDNDTINDNIKPTAKEESSSMCSSPTALIQTQPSTQQKKKSKVKTKSVQFNSKIKMKK